jgi:hypothetical protein
MNAGECEIVDLGDAMAETTQSGPGGTWRDSLYVWGIWPG